MAHQSEIAEEEIEGRVTKIKEKLTLYGINELRGFARGNGIQDFADFVDAHIVELARQYSVDELVPYSGNDLDSLIRTSMEKSVERAREVSSGASGIEGRY